ncbi:dipeptide/oligopeptide/nickel ABC transporter permease/ATP-binding protein [Kribbella soli]|uniref:Dipeptide/oligopeptide/nickel ABC transporter permease/ATP-binding protein n=1 Tax=Kribbella soli TaxID=1124743 RepID=A0A4R0HCS2_9ACTN|nr:dipeptide/oligopeptide/nickel ABC transporter permease/ATP-binding protein [Kribbella soli]TCC08043.1 dipeptide/oligopeptide/nickel ABC transporter permease/ATP-binding protein [Kribbella soli]
MSAEAIADAVPTAQPGPKASTRSRFAGLRSAKTMTGLVMFGVFVLAGAFGPLVWRKDPSALSNDILQPPSGAHWFGTTQTGQDILAQVLVGTRVSLLVGVTAAVLATVLSLLVGLTAGYVGGLTDELFSALANVFLVIPALPLVVVLAGYLPTRGSLTVAVVISLTGWSWGARILRAQTLSIRRRDFVEAARATGERPIRIILFEILPNEFAIVASSFLFTIVFAILTQAGLAFLGLSDVTTWSWGGILYWAQNNQALQSGAWWWFVPPGLCIAVIGMALALINFGIDEFVNPRLRVQKLGPKRARRMPMAKSRPLPASRRTDVVLEVTDLHVNYGEGPDAVKAVDGVDLVLRRGEVLGIAGESGSGKSTLAYAITRLLRPPGEVVSGSIHYWPRGEEPVDVLRMSADELRAFRWAELAIVFQSAMNSLNPVLTLRVQMADALTAHRPGTTSQQRDARVVEVMTMVGLPADRADAYPHELSGGMRQRALIAMALVLEPDVLVLDEPTTALDVVVQRQILNQIMALREQLGFAVVFITHDLSLLIEVADRIAIMYAGRVIETGSASELYRSPQHPYSDGLLRSFPHLHGPRKVLTGIPGTPPDLRIIAPGCPFQPRCGQAIAACTTTMPLLLATTEGHQVACLLTQPRSSDDDEL